MKIAFFDTETTGLPLWDKPSEDPAQPRIVQIAWRVDCTEKDLEHEVYKLIRPNGWTIPDEAAAIHRITQERAFHEGHDAQETIMEAAQLLLEADLIVGHGVKFDMRMMRIELKRYAPELAEQLEKKKTFCTLERSTYIVKLPPTEKMLAKGMNKPKPPKLAEAYAFFFKEPLPDAHDARVDMEACARIYYRISKKKAA